MIYRNPLDRIIFDVLFRGREGGWLIEVANTKSRNVFDTDLFHSQMGQNNCDHTFMHDPLQTSKYTKINGKIATL